MKRQKDQRGFGLIECLIVLGLTVVLLALSGQALQSVFQGLNEGNVSKAMLAIQNAEMTYSSTYSNGYATGADAAYLSTCPAAGQPLTKTAACLIPSSYTSGATVYGYSMSILTPTDAPACSVSPCGFLAVATPKTAASGRLSYCTSALGTLNGEVATALPLTTNAAGCSTLPVRAAGATPVTATVPLYRTSASGLNISNSGQVLLSLPNLPPGVYEIQARVTAQWPSLPTTTNIGISCDILNTGNELSPTNIVESEGSASSSDPNYMTISLVGIITLAAGQTAEISGFNWGTATPSQMGGWNGVMTATPVTERSEIEVLCLQRHARDVSISSPR